MKTNQTIQTLIDKKIAEGRNEYTPTSWNISKLGSCLTGMYLERLGVKPDTDFDERTLRVFNVGNIFEDWVVDIIKSIGKEVETQTRLEDKKLGVSGKLDLKVDGVIYEIKSKHSKAFWYMLKQGKPMSQHEEQLWTYLYLTNTEKGILVYVSKDDLAIQEYPVYLENKEIKERVFSQLKILNEAWEKKLPPPPPDDKSWQAKYCRWHKQCLVCKEYLTIN
jgi:CRISPR/Cas system-associated exonuclease Cas4 (RecB family)